MSKFTVGIEFIKRTTKEIEADTKEDAKNIFLGELSRGELPEVDEIWDSIAVTYVQPVSDPEGTFEGLNETQLQ